ncbi:hypothetical protein [Variovorax sp. J22R115]|uniref:hypothetical protein n=1 Tax=Variovorax sp. J22R115 TaxID=3053509 RepID=UPI002576E2D5|nr:hypothetical protein [Variovorax sp. J22R115]MDM0053747.1 hypothetical protein [Variovorax sp. J22R115]
MKVESDIKLFPRRPTETAWSTLRRLADDWNQSHVHAMSEVSGLMMQINLPDSAPMEIEDFTVLLEKMRREVGVDAYGASRRLYDERDYLEVPFVQIFGAVLDRPERPFVVNAGAALGPPTPCPACGNHSTFDATQCAPFAIRESLLDDACLAAEMPYGGWDVVALPAGRVLVSARLLSTLRRGDVQGLEVRPVLQAETGMHSTRAFQIGARRAILTPCDLHAGDVSFCATCGAVRAGPDEPMDRLFIPEPEFHIRDRDLAGDEVMSRHPSRSTMLYFAQRAYRLMFDAGLNGIAPSNVIRVCDHQ